MAQAKISFRNVKKYFPGGGLLRKSYIRAVNGVSFDIREGEILAVVGESGCGKTTMARMLMKLYDPTEGAILVDGCDIAKVQNRREIKKWHSNIQMIFQDPFASLNPAHTVRGIISRAVTLHFPALSDREVQDRVEQLLILVGLTPPRDFMGKHPAQLSGGQRQRIVIARALAVEPDILVADEPTSMLDVSIGIDIMNLLLDLKEKKRLTMMYITHNLAGARYIADDMVVMYAGNAVEYGRVDEIIAAPYHPYTVLLLNSTPEPFRQDSVTIQASEELPDIKSPQTDCLFCSRCPLAMERCRSRIPEDYTVGSRRVKCFLYEGRDSVPRPLADIGIYAAKEETA